MRQSYLTARCFLVLALALALGAAPAAEARDFTVGLKAWQVSGSVTGANIDDELFAPGVYFSWGVTDRFWISAGYVEGEADFRLLSDLPEDPIARSLEEVDFDIIFGWSFPKVDVGIGYREAEFTFKSTATPDATTSSAGPMVFLGGGDLFGQSRWGYYWGLAYMFEDVDDDPFKQKHFNGEGGLRWTSQKNLSILFGYRYKEYSGEGTNGLTFDGPVVNLAYTWR